MEHVRNQGSKIGGTFFAKTVPPSPLLETLTLAGILISPKGKLGFRQRLEVLGEGFGEDLLTRRASPILTALTAKEI
jgi:hypothetical protein